MAIMVKQMGDQMKKIIVAAMAAMLTLSACHTDRDANVTNTTTVEQTDNGTNVTTNTEEVVVNDE